MFIKQIEEKKQGTISCLHFKMPFYNLNRNLNQKETLAEMFNLWLNTDEGKNTLKNSLDELKEFISKLDNNNDENLDILDKTFTI